MNNREADCLSAFAVLMAIVMAIAMIVFVFMYLEGFIYLFAGATLLVILCKISFSFMVLLIYCWILLMTIVGPILWIMDSKGESDIMRTGMLIYLAISIYCWSKYIASVVRKRRKQ